MSAQRSVCAGLFAAGACAATWLGPVSALAQPVLGEDTYSPIIYGSDDRQDYYEVDDSVFQDVGRQSVLALIAPDNLERTARGIQPLDITLADQLLCVTTSDCVEMCPEERFLDQPSAGECSGVLVDDDLVLTAGHCFDGLDDDCNRYRYVFDFYYEADGQLAPMSSADVYSCDSLVLWQLGPDATDPSRDYALVKLDRAVDASRVPVTLRTEPLSEGDMVAALGFPIGLPLKIDLGGAVKEPRAKVQDYFTATTDTYVGNSGSGMFDENGHLAGHLVLGGSDFDIDSRRNCLTSVVVPDSERASLYEHGVYVDTWRSQLCAGGYDSERLCGVDAPPIKTPVDPGDLDAGSSDAATGVRKSGRGCSAAPGQGLGVGLAWFGLAVGLLLRRRARA